MTEFKYTVGKPKNLQYRSDWDTDYDGHIDKEEREAASAESSE